jgi:glycosyltransferase involved in cell wall biosynthesis
MHIAIDARFVGPEQTGLGRYTEELVHGLAKIDKTNRYSVLLSREGFDYFRSRSKNFHKIKADFPWYSVIEQIKMPRLLRRLNPDLVHFCHFNVPVGWRRPFVVTIHDLIKDEFKGRESTTRSSLVYNLKHWAYKKTISHALYKSTAVITISQGSRAKIIKRYGLPESKIFITYEAADPKFAKYRRLELTAADKAVLQKKYGIKFPFLLYVGNAYPYKNLGRLLEALQKVDKNYFLVNPCARSVFYDQLANNARRLGLASRVILPGFVPDDDLAKLYRAATAYVFPSLSEGFGLPLLEAQMAGLPVAASAAPPLPEIGGRGAIYFDPKNSDDMAQKINELLANVDLQREMVRQGEANLKRFSWGQTARQTLAVYKKSLIQKHGGSTSKN